MESYRYQLQTSAIQLAQVPHLKVDYISWVLKPLDIFCLNAIKGSCNVHVICTVETFFVSYCGILHSN